MKWEKQLKGQLILTSSPSRLTPLMPFRGSLRSPDSLERAAEWTQQSLAVDATSPSQESSNTGQRGADPWAGGTTAQSSQAARKRTST